MSAALAVLRRELTVTARSGVARVACCVCVLGLHASFFFLGFPIGDVQLPSLFAGGVATLDALWAWLPLALAIGAPAVTMGALADERRSGGDELLLAWPVRARSIIVGKFLASWTLLVALVLVAVLPAAAVVGVLGPLDLGALAGGVLGALLLAAPSAAIGILASTLAREPLAAFVASTGVLVALWGASLAVRVLPGTAAELAWYASPALHFLESGARGVLDLRDIVYHGSLVAAALGLATLALEGRRWRG